MPNMGASAWQAAVKGIHKDRLTLLTWCHPDDQHKSAQVQEDVFNWSLENVFWQSLKRNPVSLADKRTTAHKRGPHTYSRVSWPKYVGSSSLHLPALDVKTAWNRGGHSDRLLWGSLVNSYWTPLSSLLALSSPPTHYTPQRAGLNGLVYPLSLTGTNAWSLPPLFHTSPQ